MSNSGIIHWAIAVIAILNMLMVALTVGVKAFVTTSRYEWIWNMGWTLEGWPV